MTTTANTNDALLLPKEAAALLKLSVSWLAKSRQRREGPPYLKLGRSVRYNRAALMDWLKAHRC